MRVGALGDAQMKTAAYLRTRDALLDGSGVLDRLIARFHLPNTGFEFVGIVLGQFREECLPEAAGAKSLYDSIRGVGDLAVPGRCRAMAQPAARTNSPSFQFRNSSAVKTPCLRN